LAEISVALGGGGVKGIAHFGVLNRLEQAGFKIRAIAGTSAGGVAGSVFAAGYSQTDILKALKRINQRNFFARLPNDGPSLLGLAGLIEVLSSYLDNKTFRDLKIPFAVTAVDIESKQEYIIRQGSVKDAVLATVAIPGVFPPKKIGNTNLVDGGVLDPVPVAVARWLAPTLPVVAVCLSPTPEKWSELPEFQAPDTIHIPGPILEQISRLRISQALRIFVSSMEITMHMVGETRMQIEKPDVIIRPKVHHIGILDTVDPQELVSLGDLAGKEAIPHIRSSLAWRHQLSRQFHDRTPPGKVLDDDRSGRK
jgi:NTE family protein